MSDEQAPLRWFAVGLPEDRSDKVIVVSCERCDAEKEIDTREAWHVMRWILLHSGWHRHHPDTETRKED